MTSHAKKVQIILLLLGIFLILVTYFYLPYQEKARLQKTIETQSNLESDVLNNEEPVAGADSLFERVEYKGFYDLNKTFTVKSEKAHTIDNEPDFVYMTNMEVILYLQDGRVVKILSDSGKYNKINYDCYFEKNVRATDGDTKIFAENLDLRSNDTDVKIYNDVIINYIDGSLRADKIDYNFETKYFKVSMFEDKSVKMKIFK